MKKFVLVLLSLMTLGLCASASPQQAAIIRACQVKDAPTNCENMWAIVAHVTLPKQPVTTVVDNPGCGSKFDGIDWGRTVADAFLAEANRDTLENLAMDVSDALQKKLVPQITRNIRGDAASFIENNFSKVTPMAWSPSWKGYDLALCAPVIAAVPADAIVREFRLRAWDENRGEMDCPRGTIECGLGHSRFGGCSQWVTQTSMEGITLYTAIFQNWSTVWAREGRLIIFFEMPAGWVPRSS
jgi:hypothetical protein